MTKKVLLVILTVIQKKIGSVEVGKGAFGGPFDQGDFADLDQFKIAGR